MIHRYRCWGCTEPCWRICFKAQSLLTQSWLRMKLKSSTKRVNIYFVIWHTVKKPTLLPVINSLEDCIISPGVERGLGSEGVNQPVNWQDRRELCLINPVVFRQAQKHTWNRAQESNGRINYKRGELEEEEDGKNLFDWSLNDGCITHPLQSKTERECRGSKKA